MIPTGKYAARMADTICGWSSAITDCRTEDGRKYSGSARLSTLVTARDMHEKVTTDGRTDGDQRWMVAEYAKPQPGPKKYPVPLVDLHVTAHQCHHYMDYIPFRMRFPSHALKGSIHDQTMVSRLSSVSCRASFACF